MSTTTTNDVTVSADVMAQYNEAQAGTSRADIAKARGITPSTVSANIKRVQAHVDAGRNIKVDGEAVVTADAPTTVDPHEVAEGMTEGASIVTHEVAKVEAEAKAMRDKAEALRAQAGHREAEAKALTDKAMPRIEAVATALGFDIEAWRTAVVDATADAARKAEAPAPTEGAEAKA